MHQTLKTKICLVGDMLSDGGAERVHALLSHYFARRGIEVHNIIVQDVVTYNYSGELLNLGKEKDLSNGVSNKFKRLSILRNYIKKHDFDYIIDFRMRRKPVQDLLIAKFVFTAPTIYTVHSSNIGWYMPEKSWLTRAMYSKSYGVVALNNKMKQYIEQRHGLKNITVIYNPIDTAYIKNRLSGGSDKAGYDYVLAAGRLSEDNVKQFDKLIKSYAASVLPANNVKLMILGEGVGKARLEELVSRERLRENVVFMGFQENPYVYMSGALFYILSSKFEGMPMVLLEALACGIPVVAFDCFTGPSEIIDNGVNGLLIEDQDIDKLTEGINRMYLDKNLYDTCKLNAVKSIEKFSMENVGKDWMEYLKIN